MKTFQRRAFLKTGIGAAAFNLVPRYVLGGPGFVPPSEQVAVAVIGAGGMGMTDTRALLAEPEARIVAVCDVAETTDLRDQWYRCIAGRKPVKRLIEETVSKTVPGFTCAEYEDFRLLLEKENGVDAVLCATPDHLHAPVSIAAMRAGKHVYCEKPLAHSVEETRLVARVAKETGVATQMGIQGHSKTSLQLTAEWIQAGAIGTVREVHAWSDVGQWATGQGRPADTPPGPAGLNWDLWLGPRPFRPYHPAYAPYNWRGWWAFGTGAIGDMACHNMDPAVYALNLHDPLSIEACTVGEVDSEVTSHGGIYRYVFGADGARPPVTLIWYAGGLMPPYPEGLDPNDPQQQLGERKNGVLFVGEKGYITCPGWAGMPRILPLALHRSFTKPEPTLPRVKGSHFHNWLTACKGGPKACAEFGYASRMNEIVLLGNVALRTGGKLFWDAGAMKMKNAPQADAFLRDVYRKGWELRED
ncbi:MAG: Gfo/Idh/MocA family oxidoreductase [Kiritimatiellae bacterium]|nr:Gfo/Idh/MocA family oxidoreductase [Kiritimatiellia bacterium]